jgi:cytochrome c556
MKFKNVMAIVLSTVLSAGVVAPAFAGGAEDIAQRKNMMKASGGIMKGAGKASGADAVAAGEGLVANFTAMKTLWGADTMTGDTKALPAIWNADGTVSEGFETAMNNAINAAQGVLAAANTGDAAAYGASLKAMGGTCGACHMNYRAK